MSISQTFDRALKHHQAGRLPEAEQLYRQVLEAVPAHADALHLSGVIAHQAGRHAEAVALIQQAIRLQPGSAQYHANLGVVYRGWGGAEEAIAAFRAAVALDGGLGTAYENLGLLLSARGDFDGAVEALQGALRADPNAAVNHYNLGNAFQARGDLEEAIASYQRAIQFQPGFFEAYGNLGSVLNEQGRTDRALEVFRAAVRLRPDSAEAHSNLGNVLRQQGHLDQAIEACRMAIRLAPALAEAHANLGRALRQQGNLHDAIPCLQRALELRPGLLNVRAELATSLAALVPLWHVPMMNDERRNRFYLDALTAAIGPHSQVLEIGTGSGLLAMMAARSGAASVVTCEAVPAIAEVAREIIARNGLAQRIQVIAKKSSDLVVGQDAPGGSDILVSEIFSSELISEGVLDAIEDAKRRLLKPEARIIPAVAALRIALFTGEEIGRNLTVGESCGFDLSPFNAIVSKKQVIGRNDLPIDLLTDAMEAFRFDFARAQRFPAEEKTLRLPVTKSGCALGLIQWIRFEMEEGSAFENHPSVKAPASSWQWCAYLLPAPLQVEAGEIAIVSAVHNRRLPWFALEGVERPGAPPSGSVDANG